MPSSSGHAAALLVSGAGLVVMMSKHAASICTILGSYCLSEASVNTLADRFLTMTTFFSSGSNSLVVAPNTLRPSINGAVGSNSTLYLLSRLADWECLSLDRKVFYCIRSTRFSFCLYLCQASVCYLFDFRRCSNSSLLVMGM